MQNVKMQFGKNAASSTPVYIAVLSMVFCVAVHFLHPSNDMTVTEHFFRMFSAIGQYLAFSIIFFVVFWIGVEKLSASRRISRNRWPAEIQVIREVLFGANSQLVLLALSFWIADYLWPGDRANNMYTDIMEYGLLYYLCSALALFVLHDTYFYWTHRLLHHPYLYLKFHKTHHENTDPTPFTTFHFHPVEALIQAFGGWFVYMFFVFFPWHSSLPIVWVFGMMTLNVVGHLGYEIYPSWWLKLPILKQKTTAFHHYMHHQRFGGNYGLYFRFWDCVCGTEFDDYEKRYNDIFLPDIESKHGI